jgi:nicotinamide-nucleotide adenylyltransferase
LSAGGNLAPADWREREKRPIRISVLDSSFNPPTKAHLALASSPPPPSRFMSQGGSSDTPKAQLSSGNNTEAGKKQDSGMQTYDAHMLLLSVTNADKKLKPGDATYQQRLEMMTLLAHEIEYSNEIATPSSFDLCVAAIDEPTFVGKSRKLRKAVARKLSLLSNGSGHSGQYGLDSDMPAIDESTSAEWEKEINLVFVLGFDTVTRLFDPRFYGSMETMRNSLRSFFAPVAEGGDESSVVCARRLLPTINQAGDKSSVEETRGDQGQGQSLTSGMSEEELHFFTSPEVRGYWESGKVSLMEDLRLELQTISSTKARSSLAEPLESDKEIRRLLPSSIANYVFQRGLYSGLK